MTFVVGDVHGCLEELDELLKLIGPGQRIVFLGDLMDRGPDPVGVVRRVREIGAECVMGNHDEKHVRWARHVAKARADAAYKNPMTPLSPERLAQHEALGDDIEWLAQLPTRIALDDGWWAVHGGVAPKLPFAAQKNATLIRCRWVDEAGAMIGKADAPPDARHWATMWNGPEKIVYGHHVHDHAMPKVDRFAIGIDTGCCFGGRLTAYAIGRGTLIQVNAKRAYAPVREANADET